MIDKISKMQWWQAGLVAFAAFLIPPVGLLVSLVLIVLAVRSGNWSTVLAVGVVILFVLVGSYIYWAADLPAN